MPNIVRIRVDGPREKVLETLRRIREQTSQGERAQAVVWCPPRWEEESEVAIRDEFEIEVPLAIHRAEAIHRTRLAVDSIDPGREVIKGGDFDWMPLDV